MDGFSERSAHVLNPQPAVYYDDLPSMSLITCASRNLKASPLGSTMIAIRAHQQRS